MDNLESYLQPQPGRPSWYTCQYGSLSLCTLTPESHARTCNYWFTVTTGASAHTAFNSRKGLERWLEERGLKMTAELPARGVGSCQRIEGSYRETSWMSYDDFFALEKSAKVVTKALSNGDYTLAYITEDEDGVRNVHHLNPNMRRRVVYDHGLTHQEMN